MILMSEMPAEDAHDVIHHGGRVVAVVVPIGEYQQLRQAMQEQQVNEEFDAARARYLARREAGRSATCPMGKRADAWACRPGELSVNWEIQALDQAAGFLRDDPIGVAALWDSASQPADEPTAAGVVPHLQYVSTAGWDASARIQQVLQRSEDGQPDIFCVLS